MIARLAGTVLVLCAAAFAGVACGPEREGRPPELEMTLDGETLTAEVQGFCVEGRCEDVEPGIGEPVEVGAGAHEAEFEWGWGSADASFAVCRGLTFEDCDEVLSTDASLDDGLDLDLVPGVYRLSVFLSWDDGNDASYHFPLEVQGS